MLSVQSMLVSPASSPTNLYPIVYDLDDTATREAYFNNKTVRTSHNCCCAYQIGPTLPTIPKQQSVSGRKGSTKAHQRNNSGVGYSKTSIHDATIIKPVTIPTFNDLYIITRLITKSKRSSVCECIHRQSGQHYCVKIFAEGNQKCSQEVFQMLSFCSNHDNLLPPYELLVENQIHQSIKGEDILMNTKTKVTPIRNSHGKVYLIVKYMELGNLKSYVTEHQSHKYMEETEAKKLAIQLLHALQYLHETAHVQHGDLSPSNILLEKVNNEIKIKVTDFGRSKGIVQTETSSAASDMLSFGSVVYFMLAGYFPTEATEKLSTNDGNVVATTPKKEMVVTYPSHFSRHAKQFLSNCFQSDPSIRLSATEALQHVWLSSLSNEIDNVKPRNTLTVITSTCDETKTTNLEQKVTKKKHHRRNATICIASLRRKEKGGKYQEDTSVQQTLTINGVDKSNNHNKKVSDNHATVYHLLMNYYSRIYSKGKVVSSRNLNIQMNDNPCDETLTTTSSMQSVVSMDDEEDDDVEVVTHPTKMGRNAIYRSWWS